MAVGMADLEAVVASGDRRASLEAIRDRLAAEMASPEVRPRDVAALARQLADVIRELDEMPATGEASPLDELAAARAARRSDAAVPKRAASGNQRRSGGRGTRGKRGSAP